MKNITAFVGSAGKKNTYKAVAQFMDDLQMLGEVECKIVILSNYKPGLFRGCRLCFHQGEQFCLLKEK